MPRSSKGEALVCPNCHKPVDPAKPNAMLSAATKEWQHKDCWHASAPVVPPEATVNQPKRQPR